MNIDEFKLKYNGTRFIRNNKLSIEVLEYYIENYEVDWVDISYRQTLTETFIIKYSDKVNWYYVSAYQTLSESFIDKYSNKMSWYFISKSQALSEAFIERYNGKVNWLYISNNQTLTESFIEQYKDKLDWDYISAYQTLTESFITKYKDKVRWINLFRNKKINMSYEFLLQHLYKFNLYEVSNNNNVTMLIKEFPDKYRLDKISYEFNK